MVNGGRPARKGGRDYWGCLWNGLAFAHRFAAAGMRLALLTLRSQPLIRHLLSYVRLGWKRSGFDATFPTRIDGGAGRRGLRGLRPRHVICLNPGGICSWNDGRPQAHRLGMGLGVNLWGVIHGIDTFSTTLTQDEGHFVITASIWGHTCYPTSGPYRQPTRRNRYSRNALQRIVGCRLTSGGHRTVPGGL
ncbi:hypothetical protein CM1200mP19_0330 [bacterium]|nr:MAG: hypothetical protein CM1200mP19_0330 [bacterium]